MATPKWKKFLTDEEYYGPLGQEGRMLADYWTEFLPKMCAKMKAERLIEMRADLLRQGYDLYGD